jgi:hypothetical protein
VRYKIVPEPVDPDLLEAVRGAVPLVPGSVEDCCTRIRDRTALPSREEAREWLTFCQALGLVAETDRGYYRIRDDPDPATLRERFRESVFGAREIHEALVAAGEPLDAAAVFESVRGAVPRWERDRRVDWETEWRDRVRVLLEWGVAFGQVERADGGYRVRGER